MRKKIACSIEPPDSIEVETYDFSRRVFVTVETETRDVGLTPKKARRLARALKRAAREIEERS